MLRRCGVILEVNTTPGAMPGVVLLKEVVDV